MPEDKWPKYLTENLRWVRCIVRLREMKGMRQVAQNAQYRQVARRTRQRASHGIEALSSTDSRHTSLSSCSSPQPSIGSGIPRELQGDQASQSQTPRDLQEMTALVTSRNEPEREEAFANVRLLLISPKVYRGDTDMSLFRAPISRHTRESTLIKGYISANLTGVGKDLPGSVCHYPCSKLKEAHADMKPFRATISRYTRGFTLVKSLICANSTGVGKDLPGSVCHHPCSKLKEAHADMEVV
jgi:hypothetical protein